MEEAGRVVGAERVGRHPTDRVVTVGSEADLADLPLQDLVVMVDADGLMFGTNYRAAEEALRVGARLAGRLRPGSGRRLMVQTSEPEHPVVVALRRADPVGFLEQELAERRGFGYPPSGELVVVEARGAEDPDTIDRGVRDAAGPAAVLGPAPGPSGLRWLIQGQRLDEARLALRPLVQRVRDSGATVRIDVDPIDL
jgi:primosomal protein N' (replication factor Y)